MDFKAIAEAGTAHARAKLANERAYADRAADRLFDEIRTARAHCGNSGALAIATSVYLRTLHLIGKAEDCEALRQQAKNTIDITATLIHHIERAHENEGFRWPQDYEPKP